MSGWYAKRARSGVRYLKAESHHQGLLKEFMSDKLPVVGAFGKLLPIWRHLFLRPQLFFTILADTETLSFRNAFLFCWMSSSFVIATMVTFDRISEDIFGRSGYKDITGSLMSEIGAQLTFFVVLILIGTASAFLTHMSCLIFFFKNCGLQKLIISSLYMTAFLMTINIYVVVPGTILGVLFPNKNNSDFINGMQQELRQTYFLINYQNYHIPTLLFTWGCIYFVWGTILMPAMSLSSTMYVTGIRPGRLTLANAGVVILLVASVVLVSYIIYLIFR
jgi:hypothetical protein